MYVNAEILFEHFHHLLSLETWATCRLVCKEWRAVSDHYQRDVVVHCVNEIVPCADLLHLSLNDLCKNYMRANKLRKAAVFPGTNLDLKIASKQFLCSPQMNQKDFIAYSLQSFGDNTRGDHLHLYDMQMTYLRTPAFLALLLYLYGKVGENGVSGDIAPITDESISSVALELPQVLRNCTACIESYIGNPNQITALATLSELCSIHEQLYGTGEVYAGVAQWSEEARLQAQSAWIFVVSSFLCQTRQLLADNYFFARRGVEVMRSMIALIQREPFIELDKKDRLINLQGLKTVLNSLMNYCMMYGAIGNW